MRTSPLSCDTTIIYSGGTFGCVGVPLAPAPLAHIAPVIHALIAAHHLEACQVIATPIVKDSSAITTDDWFDWLCLIAAEIHRGVKRIVLIHGTDTLAYTAALLDEVFGRVDVRIAVTGSQYPLLSPAGQLDYTSDALGNLLLACRVVQQDVVAARIVVAFDEQVLTTCTTQKAHTTSKATFVGCAAMPQTQARESLPQSSLPLFTPMLRTALNHVRIEMLYAVPRSVDQQLAQLQRLIDSPVDALVLLGFGAGNFVAHPDIVALCEQLIARGTLLVVGTQVPFGGVHPTYATGCWLIDIGAISAGKLSVAAIYARLLWCYAVYDDVIERKRILGLIMV